MDREKLLIKLQLQGIPLQFCKIIHLTLSKLAFFVRSNDSISRNFESFNGVPQGDPLSPLFYNLFTYDLPLFLNHEGVKLSPDIEVKYLLYADDLVVVASTASELQKGPYCLKIYADENNLTVNVGKTKCMIFAKGSCPKGSLFYDKNELEICNEFTYLGVVLTPKLSSQKHVNHIVSKCEGRIGYLFSSIPMKEIPLPVSLKIFDIYILPIITHAISTWYPRATEPAICTINAIFTKFLKRYLGIPYGTCNMLVHFACETTPLDLRLGLICSCSFYKLIYPAKLGGVQFKPPPDPNPAIKYFNIYEEIPSYFWMSPVSHWKACFLLIQNPEEPCCTKSLTYITLIFVPLGANIMYPDRFFCVCKFCGLDCQQYHFRNCSELLNLTPCQRMRRFNLFWIHESLNRLKSKLALLKIH